MKKYSHNDKEEMRSSFMGDVFSKASHVQVRKEDRMCGKKIGLIERRIIEAQAIVPLIIAFGKKIGLERAETLVQRNNEAASKEYGRHCAESTGSNNMADLAREIASWGEGGVLEETILKLDSATNAFNVTRCLYAERYAALGIRQFGYCLSCCRDQPFVEGFNPKITLTRTQTIMEGAPYCDFRYTLGGTPDCTK